MEALRTDTTRRLEALDALVSEKLVGRDFYLARDESLGERVKSLERDRRDATLFRRAMIIALTSVFLTALVSLVLTIGKLH